jgi:hypothetical protein
MLKVELPLHRQLRVGDFSFRFLCHSLPSIFEIALVPEHFIEARQPSQVTAANILSCG